MELLSIELRNIGNISELSISVPEDPVVPVTGKNGAGKSNFLKALSLLFPKKGVQGNKDFENILKDGSVKK